jgi:hypothetical protein
MNALTVGIDQPKTAVQMFNDYYIPHACALLEEWRKKHPLIRACAPLRADLHTNIPPSKQWDETLF